jgi:peptidyl-prolyl cis-trans isomerase C
MKRILPIVLLSILVLSLLAGCSRNNPSVTAAPNQSTPTEEPMALKVNGEGITMTEYQSELTRLQDALTQQGVSNTAEEQRDRVISDFTDQLLLAQAAAQAGYVVDDATLQARIDALASQMGGLDRLQAWQSAYGYTDASFRTALKRSIAAAWQRDQLVNSVPTTADQVHARQILVQEEANANLYYQEIQNGTVFAELAYTLDPATGGDLGWFPQGYLTQPEVEEAAFALQPGEYSPVIKSALGYHIIYVIERDATHALSVDARSVLQQKALDEWLASSRAAATIEVLVQ